MARSLIFDLLRIKKLDISLAIFIGIILIGLIGPLIYTVDPIALLGPRDSPPTDEFPLGTDTYGRDLLAQLLNGIKVSIYVGFTAASISLAIGVVIGVISGYKAGLVDEVLMVVTNVMLTLPSILLMMLVAAYLKERNMLYVALVIGITSWPWVARAVRAQIMSLKEREFVYMSRMSGLRDAKIAFADLLPNMASYIFMAFILLTSGAMLAEAGLSMIGLGITRGSSLGVILYWAQLMESVRRGLFWWFIPPGAILVALATSLLVMSTSLDEYFSPRLRSR